MGTRCSLRQLSGMSGYKPSLVPTVLSTERRSNCLLSDPTSSVQQGSCTRGASKSGICRAAVLLLCEIELELEISIDLMNHRLNYNFSFKRHTKSKAWSMAWVRIKYLQLQREERWGDQDNWKGSHTCFLKYISSTFKPCMKTLEEKTKPNQTNVMK